MMQIRRVLHCWGNYPHSRESWSSPNQQVQSRVRMCPVPDDPIRSLSYPSDSDHPPDP